MVPWSQNVSSGLEEVIVGEGRGATRPSPSAEAAGRRASPGPTTSATPSGEAGRTGTARRPLLAALVAALVLLAAVLAHRPLAAPTFTLVSLTTEVSHQQLRAYAIVRASPAAEVGAFGVCVQDAAGREIPTTRLSASIRPGGTASTPATTTLAAGSYVAYACLTHRGRPVVVGERRPLVVQSTTDASEASDPRGVPGDWRLTMADDFDGSALEPDWWSTGWFGSGITAPIHPHEPLCYDPAQVQLRGDGFLTLSLVARSRSCGGRPRPYVSGLVSSNGRYAYRYGVAEARIRLPADSTGRLLNWPAFWTNGQRWPEDGENDITEVLNGQIGSYFHSRDGVEGFEVPGSWAGWHTYGADWQPGKVSYYYDGNIVGSVDRGVTDSKMYLVLNHAGAWRGPTVPADMQVDYVRVWQR
jgi:hypothetical protein